MANQLLCSQKDSGTPTLMQSKSQTRKPNQGDSFDRMKFASVWFRLILLQSKMDEGKFS